MKRTNKVFRFFTKILTLILCLVTLCGGLLSAADADEGTPSIIVGNQRETVSLDGEWKYFTEEAGGEIPKALPADLVFEESITLPSYSNGVDQAERIWYQKTFFLVNEPTEAVILDFGTDIGATAVYVNNVKTEINIAPFLHAGENTIVLMRQRTEETEFYQSFTDRIEMIFSRTPVITSVSYQTDFEAGTVSFEIGLFNPKNQNLETDVSITLRDPEGNRKAFFVLEDVDVLQGSHTTASVSGLKIENYKEENIWNAAKPYLYTAEIVTSGDCYEMQFAFHNENLFGTEGFRYGTDLIVSEFFANEKNQGLAWQKEWITAFFKLIKEINWTVITYRGGNLPELWHEIALQEGILLVDKNEDAEWAQKQDRVWTKETDIAAKASEIKANDSDAVILPVLYQTADGFWSDIPMFSGVGMMRLKNIFSKDDGKNTQPQEEPSRGIITYFKEMLYKTFIRDNRYKLFLEGLGNTLLIAVASTGFGVIIGMLIAIIKVWNHQRILAKKKNAFLYLLNFIAEFYTTIIRGTPVVVQLLITYNIIFVFSDQAVLVGIFAFSINSGAYVSEIIRAGINSVDKGQTEAGRSLGLSQITTMKSIVLPQAFKNILPALGNEFIAVLKETSVIGYLGVIDLTRAGELVRSRTADAFFTLLFVALVYLILVFGLSAVFKRFERRLNKSDRN
ncbi:MAG: ABC transporter permease subunit [Clostridiales bacterium]|nr:ABC transporter permease subunit [Clostridiales bacterium]